MRENLEYGRVKFIEGEHKGKTGSYDDDDSEGAIVYPHFEIDDIYLIVPYKFLESYPLTQNEKNGLRGKRV